MAYQCLWIQVIQDLNWIILSMLLKRKTTWIKLFLFRTWTASSLPCLLLTSQNTKDDNQSFIPVFIPLSQCADPDSMINLSGNSAMRLVSMMPIPLPSVLPGILWAKLRFGEIKLKKRSPIRMVLNFGLTFIWRFRGLIISILKLIRMGVLKKGSNTTQHNLSLPNSICLLTRF